MTYARVADGAEAAVRAVIEGVAAGLAVATSGSTGAPKVALVGAEALLASAEATHRRLDGPGRWLLALPTDRIAGAQVLLRSALAGEPPRVLGGGPFDARTFAGAVRDLAARAPSGVPLYTSLVPTQLRRVLADADATRALACFAAVLVGGAPLLDAEVPSNVIETYGATETSGGCVYDGVPLDGVDVEIGQEGAIRVAGPVLFDGYEGEDSPPLIASHGRTWLAMPDAGAWSDGRLLVLGRLDDVVMTGGHKVHPAVVERALVALEGVAEAVVVAVPDDEWGERLVALVVPDRHGRGATTDAVRAALAGSLPRFALPREVREVDSLPSLAPGKIDRVAAQAQARSGF